jgi:hypothetical protein
LCQATVLPAHAKSKAGQMPDVKEMPPWYHEWREALESVIATGIARDRTKRGTPEREAADREHDDALALFREAAQQIR